MLLNPTHACILTFARALLSGWMSIGGDGSTARWPCELAFHFTCMIWIRDFWICIFMTLSDWSHSRCVDTKLCEMIKFEMHGTRSSEVTVSGRFGGMHARLVSGQPNGFALLKSFWTVLTICVVYNDFEKSCQ